MCDTTFRINDLLELSVAVVAVFSDEVISTTDSTNNLSHFQNVAVAVVDIEEGFVPQLIGYACDGIELTIVRDVATIGRKTGLINNARLPNQQICAICNQCLMYLLPCFRIGKFDVSLL